MHGLDEACLLTNTYLLMDRPRMIKNTQTWCTTCMHRYLAAIRLERRRKWSALKHAPLFACFIQQQQKRTHLGHFHLRIESLQL